MTKRECEWERNWGAYLLSGEPVALGGQELFKTEEDTWITINTTVKIAEVVTAEGKLQLLQFLLDAASALGVQDLESAHDNVLGISA